MVVLSLFVVLIVFLALFKLIEADNDRLFEERGGIQAICYDTSPRRYVSDLEFSSTDGELNFRTKRSDGTVGCWRQAGILIDDVAQARVEMNRLRAKFIGKED